MKNNILEGPDNTSSEKMARLSHAVHIGEIAFEVAKQYGRDTGVSYYFINKKFLKPAITIVGLRDKKNPNTYSKITISVNSKIVFNYNHNKMNYDLTNSVNSDIEKRINNLYEQIVQGKQHLEYLKANPSEAVKEIHN
ncbi:MAG: hypothetical protein ABH828_02225 [archaeon]